MVVDRLLEAQEEVLAKITESSLRRYDCLQRQLFATNVSIDREWQRIYKGFYRVRRNDGWCRRYFSYFEDVKLNQGITFAEVILQGFGPSFSSKLVATVRPELPVWDNFVMTNLEQKKPYRGTKPPEDFLQQLVATYSSLQARVNAMVRDEKFRKLRRLFDARFPAYTHFTDVKKLDLFLWQLR